MTQPPIPTIQHVSRGTKESDGSETLSEALRAIVMHPLHNLLGLWNWKAASLSAALRACTFLLTNLRSGAHKAVRAMLIEAVFAIFAAGVMGAVVQRLRSARPPSATAAFVWLAMPVLMVTAQLGVHHLAGTPHVKVGLIASFCFAAIASGFTWYTMRRGVLLAGGENTSLAADARALPQVILDFILALPRALFRAGRTS